MKHTIGDVVVTDGKFGVVFVIRPSMITGKVNTMVYNNTTSQAIADWLTSPKALIQDAFPQMTPDEREFLLSGITPQEWQQHIATSEEDEDDG